MIVDIETIIGTLRLTSLLCIFFGMLWMSAVGSTRVNTSIVLFGLACAVLSSTIVEGFYGFMWWAVFFAVFPMFIAIVLYCVRKVVLFGVERRYGDSGVEVNFEPLKIYREIYG